MKEIITLIPLFGAGCVVGIGEFCGRGFCDLLARCFRRCAATAPVQTEMYANPLHTEYFPQPAE